MEDLKKLHAIWQTGSDDAAADASNDIMEALPELLARVKRLEEALAILNAAHEFEGEPDDKKLFVAMRVSDLRRARAALKETGQ